LHFRPLGPVFKEGLMSDSHDTAGAHEGPIKTPKQLAWAVALSFIVPILIIILLVNFVAMGGKPAAGTAALDEEAVARRIAPVARVVLKDASSPGALKSGAAKAEPNEPVPTLAIELGPESVPSRKAAAAPRWRGRRRRTGTLRPRPARAAPPQVDVHPRHRGRCPRRHRSSGRIPGRVGRDDPIERLIADRQEEP